MILPIYTFGNAVLRKETKPIDAHYPGLKQLISDMFETMHQADGIGLAAPQIGLPIRLLIVDLSALKDDNPEFANCKTVMINPVLLEMSEEEEEANEGCLSIPGISEKVMRSQWIKVQYVDEHFKEHISEFDGFYARVIQHEYDHLEGHLFTDHINPLRRQLIKSKLNNISRGKVDCEYKTKSP